MRCFLRARAGWPAYLGIGLLGLLLLLNAGVAVAGEWRISNDSSVTANDVSGDGDDQSSLTEGVRYLDVFSLYGRGNLGTYQYSLNLGAKMTDDSRNDSEKFSLTDLSGRLSNNIHTITAGDTFESFSQYSLNTAVKGFSYRYTDNSNLLPDVTVLCGVAYSRWDNLWGVDAVDRQVMGVRLHQNLPHDLWIAFNATHAFDHGRVNGSSLYQGTTYSLDWEYLPIPGLTMRGESAITDTRERPDADQAIDKGDYAHRIEAIGDGGPSRVSLEYERVAAEFLTLLGSVTPDREKIKSKWRYKYSKTVSYNLGFLWYRDNLDGKKTTRTDHYKPEVGATVKQLFGRSESVADVTYRFDRAYGDSRSTKNHFGNLGYQDRFWIIDNVSNFGVTFYSTRDNQRDNEYIYNTSLSTRHPAGIFVLKPTVYAGGWTLDNDLEDTRDQIWEYALGLGLDIPSAKITSSLKVGQNWLNKEMGTDSRKNYARLNLYYRPDFLAGFNSGMLYLRAFVNDFDYTTNERNFRENSVTAGMSIQF